MKHFAVVAAVLTTLLLQGCGAAASLMSQMGQKADVGEARSVTNQAVPYGCTALRGLSHRSPRPRACSRTPEPLRFGLGFNIEIALWPLVMCRRRRLSTGRWSPCWGRRRKHKDSRCASSSRSLCHLRDALPFCHLDPLLLNIKDLSRTETLHRHLATI